MRQACHDFQSVVEAYYRDPDESLQADFHSGLAGFRDTIALCVIQLCSLYDIDVTSNEVRIVADSARPPKA